MGRDSRGYYDDDDEQNYGRPSRNSGERSVPPSRGGPPTPPNGRGSDPNRRSYGGPSRPPSSAPSGYGPAAGPRRASRPGDTPPQGPGGPRSSAGGPPSRAGMSRPESGYDSGRRPAQPGGTRSGAPAPERRSMRERAADLARGMSEQLGAVVNNARNALQSRDQGGRDAGRGGGGRDFAQSSAGGFDNYSGAVGAVGGGGGAGGGETAEASQSGGYRRSRIRLLSRKWRLGRRNPNAIWAGVIFAVCGLLLAAILGSVVGGGYYAVSYYEANASQIAAVANEANQPHTTIYDRNGLVLYTMPKAGNVSVYLPYSSISTIVGQETVSTEDRTFFDNTNIGINFSSIARALLSNASSGGSQGGSTITQQLVKNLIIDNNSKSYIRKANEAIIAVGMTESGAYKKWKILEMYLDTIPYANTNVGIEAAAQRYFGLTPYPIKTAAEAATCGPKGGPYVSTDVMKVGGTCYANQQLTWGQAAMLVGIPNAPSIFFPTQFTFDCANPKIDNCSQPSEWDNPCFNHEDPRTAPDADCFDGSGNGPTNYDFYTYDAQNNPGAQGHEWLSYRRAKLVLDSVVRDHIISQAQETKSLTEILNILTTRSVYVNATGSSTFGSGGQIAGNNTQNNQSSGNTDHSPSDDTSKDNCGENKCAPHFVDYVVQELINDYGFGTIDNLEAAGIKVYTTLDLKLDTYAITDEQYYLEYTHKLTWTNYCDTSPYPCDAQPPLSQWENINNAAAVAMDPYTGDILAMVGSVNYNDKSPKVDGQYNVAISPRSLGSTMKGIVYATAFQMGWDPGVMMQDDPTCTPNPETPPTDSHGKIDPTQFGAASGCGGAWYAPTNYEDTSFSGYVPVRYAIANSLNVPAVEAMSYVGDSQYYSDDFLSMANRMGITTLSANRMGPTTVLGAQEVPLLQLTNAYGVFAAQGKHATPRSILEITFPDGRAPYIAPKPQLQQAISPQAAYMMTSILTDPRARIADFNGYNPLEFNSPQGTWDSLHISGYTKDDDLNFPAVAAKTGTSSGLTGPNDIVTMGYSPYMALGIWAGNDDNSSIAKGVIGIAGAGYVFHDVMEYAITHYGWPKNVEFPVPGSMARGTFNCAAGLAPFSDQKSPPSCKVDASTGWYANTPSNRSTNYWAGYNYQPQTDTDWYIKNLPWLES